MPILRQMFGVNSEDDGMSRGSTARGETRDSSLLAGGVAKLKSFLHRTLISGLPMQLSPPNKRVYIPQKRDGALEDFSAG